MSEPTLSIAKNELEGEIGLFLGYGRGQNGGDKAWTTLQQKTIESIRRSGERQFYFPPPLDGERTSYDWSFLKPVAKLSFPTNASTVNLPDDFGGIEGSIVVTSSGSLMWQDLKVTGIARVLRQQADYPTSTGRPLICALEPLRGTTTTKGQSFRLQLWPKADADYILELQYYINPDCLTGDHPYTYGGAQHSETVLESCLAIAEQRLDDQGSIHTAKFRERLSASVAKDRQSKPQNLGYNRDHSDQVWYDRRDWRWYNGVTVGGVQY